MSRQTVGDWQTQADSVGFWYRNMGSICPATCREMGRADFTGERPMVDLRRNVVCGFGTSPRNRFLHMEKPHRKASTSSQTAEDMSPRVHPIHVWLTACATYSIPPTAGETNYSSRDFNVLVWLLNKSKLEAGGANVSSITKSIAKPPAVYKYYGGSTTHGRNQ